MSEIQGLPPPDTQPDKAAPVPLPTPPTPPSLQTLRSWLPLYLSKTDTVINKLSTILSTPGGTDTVLLTLCYSSLLTSNILSRISLAQLHAAARQIIEKAVSLPPNTTVIIDTSDLSIRTSHTAVAAARLKALSSLISDFRIFTRLWGLVGIYNWGKAVYNSKETDPVLRGIAQAQVTVNILFQYLENGAYLSSKGIMGWDSKKQNSAWIWSSRWWMAHVALDFIRLARESSVRLDKGIGTGTGLEEVEEEAKWIANWRKQFVVNAAWAPLTLHWSLEKGLVGEFWVGVFGSVAGIAGLRSRWRDAVV